LKKIRTLLAGLSLEDKVLEAVTKRNTLLAHNHLLQWKRGNHRESLIFLGRQPKNIGVVRSHSTPCGGCRMNPVSRRPGKVSGNWGLLFFTASSPARGSGAVPAEAFSQLQMHVSSQRLPRRLHVKGTVASSAVC